MAKRGKHRRSGAKKHAAAKHVARKSSSRKRGGSKNSRAARKLAASKAAARKALERQASSEHLEPEAAHLEPTVEPAVERTAKVETASPAHIEPARESTSNMPRILGILLVCALLVGGALGLSHLARSGAFDSLIGSGAGSEGAGSAGSAGSDSAPYVETDPLLQPHYKGTASIQGAGTVDFFGRDSFAGSEAFARLGELVRKMEDDDYTVGIALSDIEGDVNLYYEPDAQVYSASAIKGPYVIFAAEKLIDTGKSGEMRRSIIPCITRSDNDAYSAIRASTRKMGWLDYVREAGIDTEGREANFDDYSYSRMSARDFELLWHRGYPYLAAGEGAAEWIAPLFEDTRSSSIHAVLGSRYKVWSKAGWYDGAESYSKDPSETSATNDAGVVFSETGPYVLSVVTDLPIDFDRLCELVDAADMCHAELSGTDAGSRLSADTPVPVY